MRQNDAKQVMQELQAMTVCIRDRRTGQLLRPIGTTFALAKGMPITAFDCVPWSDKTTRPDTYIEDPNRHVYVPVRHAERWEPANV
jgi:hypothetical protein